MKAKSIIAAGLALSSIIMCSAEDTIDKNTLFYLPFDKDLKPEVSIADSICRGHAALTEDNGGKKGEAVIVRPGLCYGANGLETSYRPLDIKPAMNHNPKIGTIEVWVKLLEDLKKIENDNPGQMVSVMLLALERHDEFRQYADYMGFQFGFLPAPRVKPEWCVEFHQRRKAENRKYTPQEFSGMYSKGVTLRVKTPDWKKDEWHHIAVTWNGKVRAMFIDGKKAAEIVDCKYEELVPGADTMSVAGFYYPSSYKVPCLIDEFKISDVVRYTVDFVPESKK